MNVRADSPLAEKLAKCVSVVGLNYERMVNGILDGPLGGEDHTLGSFQALPVVRRICAPLLRPRLHVAKLYQNHRGLKSIEPRIARPHDAVITRAKADVAHDSQFFSERGVIRREETAVTARVESLQWMETETTHRAERADVLVVMTRENRLRAIFHNLQSVLVRDLHDRGHLAWP